MSGAPAHGMGRAVAVVAVLALLSGRAHAQIYMFEKVPVPETRSLYTMYAYYVYAHQEAPDNHLGQPFVKFHSLVSHSTGGKTDDELQDYKGVQLSILRYRDFWNLINPSKFCSTKEDVMNNLAATKDQLMVQKPEGTSLEELNVYSHTVRFPATGNTHPTDKQIPVRATGVYILVFSNCGDFKDASVSGSVIVKNSYGFLPGNEYHKLPFYGWLALIYVCLALLWMGLSFRWWRELFHIQYCIAAVILLGLLEAFVWWIFLNDWNNSGVRGTFIFFIAILSSVVKSVLSYMLVLVASLGWGVTRPYLDRDTVTKVQAITAVYIVLDFVRESVLSYRHSHSLSISFVLLCLLPVALLNGAIFYWVFTALSSLMETLRERRQLEKLVLFERLWRLLIFSLTVASLTLLFQIFDLSRSISTRWHYQWFFADGVSHLLFLLVLIVMMYLWAPHSNAQRYAYSAVDTENEKEARDSEAGGKEAAVWADTGGLDEEEEDESFWSTTHGKTGAAEGIDRKPKPEKIGGED